MAGKKRTSDQVQSDRAKIASFLLRGYNNRQIAAEMHMTEPTVSREIKALRAEWVETTQISMTEALATELTRIDQIEREAWQAWEESKKPMEVKTQAATEGQAQKVTLRRSYRTGDPRYMAIIQWCSEQRAKLLGLVKNKTLLQGDPDNPIPVTIGVDGMKDLFQMMAQREKDARNNRSE